MTNETPKPDTGTPGHPLPSERPSDQPKVDPPFEKGTGRNPEERRLPPTDPDTGPHNVPPKPEIDPLTGEPLPNNSML